MDTLAIKIWLDQDNGWKSAFMESSGFFTAASQLINKHCPLQK